MPGSVHTLAMLLTTALAAMAAVPRLAIRFMTTSLPIWNMPFSSPLGTPIFKMRPIRPPRKDGIQIFSM